MRAIRQEQFGGPEVLNLMEIPDPHPGPGQVRIAVQAAGVHLIDTAIRQGRSGGPFPPPPLPFTPGREVAGVVDEVGPGVSESLIGSSVAADLGMTGGYAEFAIAPERALFALGGELDAALGVAVIGTGTTTMGILEIAAPQPVDVALITAAAGGIGSLLVQALQATGATVVATAGSAQKASLAADLGADIAIDYSDPEWPEAVRKALDGRSVTLALDGVGGEIGRAALELLGIGGRLVMFGSSSGPLTEITTADLFMRGISATAAVGARTADPVRMQSLRAQAFEAATKGELTPLIGQRFPLAEAAEAHASITTRKTIGKVILTP